MKSMNKSVSEILHDTNKTIGYRTHKGCTYYDEETERCTHPTCILMRACAAKKRTD